MNKLFIVLFLIGIFLIAGCTSTPKQTSSQQATTNSSSNNYTESIKDENKLNDIIIKNDDMRGSWKDKNSWGEYITPFEPGNCSGIETDKKIKDQQWIECLSAYENELDLQLIRTADISIAKSTYQNLFEERFKTNYYEPMDANSKIGDDTIWVKNVPKDGQTTSDYYFKKNYHFGVLFRKNTVVVLIEISGNSYASQGEIEDYAKIMESRIK